MRPEALAHLDRKAAAEPDCACQQRIGGRPFGAIGQRGVAMFAFILAEGLDHVGQFGVSPTVSQPVKLLAVMLVDLGFDAAVQAIAASGPSSAVPAPRA